MGMLDQRELDALDDLALDGLPVGVVRLNEAGRIERYNRAEARQAGTQTWRVLGRDFFRELVGGDGAKLAAEVASVNPGSRATFEHRFTRYRRQRAVTIDVVRTTTGGAYLLIQDDSSSVRK